MFGSAPLSGITGLDFKLTDILKSNLFTLKSSAQASGVYTYSVLSGEATITGCVSSTTGDIIIPDSLGGYPVTKIGDAAFFYCAGLTNVNIPNSVTSIGNQTFEGCSSLMSIDIPDSVTSIGRRAFASCGALKSMTIGSGVISIGASAFVVCTGLINIFVSESNEHFLIVNGVLIDKTRENLIACPAQKAGNLVLPTGLLYILPGAFSKCNKLTDIILPDGLKLIADDSFQKLQSLKSVYIPSSVEFIGENVFTDIPNFEKLYCFKNSMGHYYAINKSINYELIYLKPVPNGSEAANINYASKFITGISNGISSFNGLFATEANYTVAFTPTANGYGTGTLVYVIDGAKVVDRYTVVIFGDVDGDGNIDGADAGLIVDYENFILQWDTQTDAVCLKAADVNGDGSIDSIDAGIMIDVENYMLTIEQSTGLAG